MKRGYFIILFIGLVLFISGQQACEPTITIGESIQLNTCCKLSDSTKDNCINDMSQSKCDELYSLYGNYFIKEVFSTDLANSCLDVCTQANQILSCNYQNSIYENNEFLCNEGNNKIYQCLNGGWVENTDCTTSSNFCVNAKPCSNPSITQTACSTGNCGGKACTPNCQYTNECTKTGTDIQCGLNNLCNRETDGNLCNNNAGICLSGTCLVETCNNLIDDNNNGLIDELCWVVDVKDQAIGTSFTFDNEIYNLISINNIGIVLENKGTNYEIPFGGLGSDQLINGYYFVNNYDIKLLGLPYGSPTGTPTYSLHSPRVYGTSECIPGSGYVGKNTNWYHGSSGACGWVFYPANIIGSSTNIITNYPNGGGDWNIGNPINILNGETKVIVPSYMTFTNKMNTRARIIIVH